MSTQNGQHSILLDTLHDRISKIEQDKDDLVQKLNDLSTSIQLIDQKVRTIDNLLEKVDTLLDDVAEIKYHYTSIRRNGRLLWGFIVAVGTALATKFIGILHFIGIK